MSTAAQKRKARAVLKQWKNLSKAVLSARASTSPSQINTLLDSYLADTSVRLLHPLILTWKGDNLFREAKFTQAIQEYRAVARDFPTPTFLQSTTRRKRNTNPTLMSSLTLGAPSHPLLPARDSLLFAAQPSANHPLANNLPDVLDLDR